MIKKLLFACFLFISQITFSQITQDILFKYFPKVDTSEAPFYFGVASGDVRSSSVVIWTKLVPKKINSFFPVKWFVAKENLKNVVDSGVFIANKDNFFTVKIKISNLEPSSKYFYYFQTKGKKSAVGVFKTLPAKAEKLKFAVFTGSNYSHGYFNAYDLISKNKTLDFLIHTGDYIYEYDNKNARVRQFIPNKEAVSRMDYELRYAQARLDTNLKKLHRLYAWFVIWDDHEFANDSWNDGATNHQPKEGNWFYRKNIAKETFFNWLPILPNKDSSIFKTIDLYPLVKFIFLDTRYFRDNPRKDNSDTTKTILGAAQFDWLKQQLKNSKDSFAWTFIVQQVMFTPLVLKHKVLNRDQWDGYPYEREKLLKIFFHLGFSDKDLIIFSGDIHSSWYNKVFYKKHIVGTELIAPSISSYSTNYLRAFLGKYVLKFYNHQIRFVDLYHRGYLEVEVSNDYLKARWFLINTADIPDYRVSRIKKIKIKKH